MEDKFIEIELTTNLITSVNVSYIVSVKKSKPTEIYLSIKDEKGIQLRFETNMKYDDVMKLINS